MPCDYCMVARLLNYDLHFSYKTKFLILVVTLKATLFMIVLLRNASRNLVNTQPCNWALLCENSQLSQSSIRLIVTVNNYVSWTFLKNF